MTIINESAYLRPLRFDMSDSEVEELISEVEGLFTAEFDARVGDLDTDGVIDDIVQAVMAKTGWSRSDLQTSLRRAARKRGKRVDSIAGRLIPELDGE